MNQFMQWWKPLPRKQQNQMLVLFMAVVLGGYGAYFISLNKDIKHAENMMNRSKNRMAAKYKNIKEPKQNPAVIKKKLDILAADLQQKSDRLAGLEESLMPLDSMTHVQQMRLSISQLAERSGMVIRKMEGRIDRRMSDVESEPGEEFLRAQLNNRYQRPLINLTSTVDFRGLLAFLDGLQGLDYNVSPVKINIHALVPDQLDPDSALQQQQFLRLRILLAL